MLWLVPHLFADPRLLDAALPGLRLPGLSALLARGRPTRELPLGTEAALARACGVHRQQDWPLAPLTLHADGGQAGEAYWLRADPVHFAVMRDRVVLSAADFSDLTAEEAAGLTAALASHFGEDFSPRALHPQRWYLRLDQPPKLLTIPPSLARGRALDRILPTGDDAAAWRARLNEAQMLLHTHPVNATREARGLLPVNGVWVWGGGTHLPPVNLAGVVYAASGYACGLAVNPLPARFTPDLSQDAGLILLDALETAALHQDTLGWRERLRELESHWFAPLARALRDGSCGEVELADPISGRGVRARRRDLWKVWRRPSALASLLG